jgi:cytochrome c
MGESEASDFAPRPPPRPMPLEWPRFRSAGESRIITPSIGDFMLNAVLIFAIVTGTAGAAHAQHGQDLLRKYDCYICHADTETKTGPAYVDIAAKYRSDPKGVASLTAMVKKGAHGSGPWHMPPMPQVPDADARKIADYILSLKP